MPSRSLSRLPHNAPGRRPAAFAGLRMFLALAAPFNHGNSRTGFRKDTSGTACREFPNGGQPQLPIFQGNAGRHACQPRGRSRPGHDKLDGPGRGNIRQPLGRPSCRHIAQCGGARRSPVRRPFQSGVAIGSKAAVLGSRTIDQSALIIAVEGDADAAFTVLVDDAARGQVAVGERLSLFMPAYHQYRVRLVPVASTSMSYDTAEREVTLYPGNVRLLGWRADSFFTIFGQAISAGGAPIANASVETAKSVGETDQNGYFQVDIRRGDRVGINTAQAECQLELGNYIVKDSLASVGKVVCR